MMGWCSECLPACLCLCRLDDVVTVLPGIAQAVQPGQAGVAVLVAVGGKIGASVAE
jgi:hypothetical protein